MIMTPWFTYNMIMTPTTLLHLSAPSGLHSQKYTHEVESERLCRTKLHPQIENHARTISATQPEVRWHTQLIFVFF